MALTLPSKVTRASCRRKKAFSVAVARIFVPMWALRVATWPRHGIIFTATHFHDGRHVLGQPSIQRDEPAYVSWACCAVATRAQHIFKGCGPGHITEHQHNYRKKSASSARSPFQPCSPLMPKPCPILRKFNCLQHFLCRHAVLSLQLQLQLMIVCDGRQF